MAIDIGYAGLAACYLLLLLPLGAHVIQGGGYSSKLLSQLCCFLLAKLQGVLGFRCSLICTSSSLSCSDFHLLCYQLADTRIELDVSLCDLRLLSAPCR